MDGIQKNSSKERMFVCHLYPKEGIAFRMRGWKSEGDLPSSSIRLWEIITAMPLLHFGSFLSLVIIDLLKGYKDFRNGKYERT
jgi:hypothetical protein